jgi:MscS family membrane protein
MNLWDQLPVPTQETLLRILLTIVALVVLWLIRRLLIWLLLTPIRRLTARSGANWDEVLLEASVPPIRILFLAFGLYLATRILGLDPQSSLFLDRVGRSLVIIAVFVIVYRVVDMVTGASTRLYRVAGVNVEPRLLPFLRTGMQIIILAILLVIIIGEWGYDVSGLIAGLGLGGLAVSLAAQDTIANVFGFSAIVADRPFVVGESIKTPDVEGTVEHVGLRSTRVRQPDQALVTLPNSKLVSSAILNWSRLSKRWLNLTLRIDYNANSQQIQSLIERLRTTLAEREHVETDSVVVFFTNFGDQALEVLVRCYIMQPEWTDFSREKEAINLEIMRIIEELHLSIALPNRTVYIDSQAQRSND